MGRLSRAGKVKLIVGLLSNDTSLFPRVRKALERAFGPVDFESPFLEFSHTDYYEDEMGSCLKRKFLSFAKLADPAKIYKAKIRTNSIEENFARMSRRRVNIDPGYLNLAKIVLFSTKDYSHRIYLNNGVYAEVTLYYSGKSYGPWPWTYPDYKSKEYLEIFNSIRDLYKENI